MKATQFKKKLLSLALAALLAVALPGAALAAPSGGNDVQDTKVTINDLQVGDTVEAFLIADAQIDASNNLTYSFAANVPAPYNTVEGLKDITSDGYTFAQGSDMQTAAGTIAGALVNVTAAATATATATSADLTLGSGYYLVRVTSTSGNTRVYQNMVVNVSPVAGTAGYQAAADFAVNVKSTPVSITKGVGEGYAPTTDKYSAGDTVPFQITTAVPSYPADSPYATFVIGDKPTAGLEIDMSSITVTGANAGDYNVAADGNGYTITFTKTFILNNPGQNITVKYNAKLTSAAFSHDATDVTGNTAKVTFNPNPYQDSTVESGSITTVQTYGFVFSKVGEDKEGVQTPLEGAVFTLYDSTGTNAILDENGTARTCTSAIVNGVAYVYFEGLAAGTYVVKETGVPSGFLKASDQTITLNADVCKGNNPATTDAENNYLVIGDSVVDKPVPDLPITGGAGTFAITAVGLILVGGGIFLAVRSRRKEEN